MSAASAVRTQGPGSMYGVRVHRPASIAEVFQMLQELPMAQVVAGATWVMRGPMRGEAIPDDLILLSGVPGLDDCTVTDSGAEFGAMATLHRIGKATAGRRGLEVLHEATRKAATPALRRMITLGGSLAATAFHASDVVPALMCLEADIVQDRGLILAVRIPASEGMSCHERLTWRSGNEYSVATVSVCRLPSTGEVRIAIGSVESAPRRWVEVEQELAEGPFTPERAEVIAQAHLAGLRPVSAPGIPADYRASVLPTVLSRAVARLA